MRTELLTITVPNWKLLIELGETFNGVSPTHILDDNKIDLKDLGSYVAIFNLDNTTIENLGGKDRSIFNHIWFSFYIEGADVFEDLIHLNSELQIYHIHHKKKFIYIVTASYKIWIDTILVGCKEETSYEVRSICNKILNVFKQSRLKELWNKYHVIMLKDETFILG